MYRINKKKYGLQEFTEVRAIYLTDDCHGWDKKYKEDHYIGTNPAPTVSGAGFSAHTHSCSGEKLFQSICIPNPNFFSSNYLRNSDGSISDLWWHEYGHIVQNIIDPVAHEQHFFKVSTDNEAAELYQANRHGKSFAEALSLIGKPEIFGRTVSLR